MVFILVGALALVVFLAPFVGYTVVGPILDRRHRRSSDAMLFEYYCRTGLLRRFMRMNRLVPADPRCRLCYVPFGGVGRILGIRPSRKNPNFCRGCFEALPEGGHHREVGVFFADLRGFTAWSEDRSPEEVANSLATFYQLATRTLMAHDAIIDKFIGDGVMALFLSDMPSLGDRTCDAMVSTAEELIEAARTLSVPLGVGVGIGFGTAWVGNVGSGEMKDFTALGDVVNMASRLQGCAKPGHIVISDQAFSRMRTPIEATSESFVVKGKDQPIAAHIFRPAQTTV